MSEQIDPGIPIDVARRDGDLITVHAGGGSFLRGNLLDLGGEPDGDDEVALPAASIPQAMELIREHELDRRIAPDIPTERAWKAGRRIYVRCGARSWLDSQLRDTLNAKWDGEEGALWTGSGKAAQAAEIIRQDAERRDRTGEVKALGLWVKVPYEASAVRYSVKEELHGIYGGDERKGQWAMPTPEAYEKARALVAEYEAGNSARKARARAAKSADRALRSRSAEEVIAASGRTLAPGAEKLSFSGELAGYMKRPEAERYAPVPGEIARVNGVRYLILDGSVQFWNEDDCADQMPHWQPGWKRFWTGIAVEPTDEERGADEREAGGR